MLNLSAHPRAAPTAIAVFAAAACALAATARAQIRFGELGERALPVGLTSSVVGCFADVDGDGDRDLLAGDLVLFPGLPIRLLDNDGRGRFRETLGRVPIRPMLPRAIACGDVDGDGDQDLVVGNGSHQQNVLWLNDGSGKFADVTATHLPGALDDTSALLLADVNGDGNQDLVVGNDVGFDVLLLNDGTGRFSPGGSLPAHPADVRSSIAGGDIDGDGDVDLVLGSNGGQNRIYRNDGGGRFTDVTSRAIPARADATTSLSFAAVSVPGVLDLVVGNWGEPCRLYANDGRGVFADATAAALPATSGPVTSIAVIDRGGDRRADIALGRWGAPNCVLVNDGLGRFREVPLGGDSDYTNAIACADVDGDGDLDLYCANAYSVRAPSHSVLWVDTGAGFECTAAARVSSDAEDGTAAAAADVDGDGDVDILVADEGGGRLLRADDRGRLLAEPAPYLANARAIAVGDVDGDGDLDLALGCDLQNRLLLGDGTGGFVDVTARRMPIDSDDTTDVQLEDVDGDGDLDLVMSNRGLSPSFAQQNRLYRNDGAGSFADVTGAAMPSIADFSEAIALGDVDGDGDADLVIGNRSVPVGGPPQPTRLWLNDGNGAFTDATAGRVPVDDDPTRDVALVDVDGDADLDIVVVNFLAQVRLYLNDGKGVFADGTGLLPPLVTAATSVACGDCDDDGDVDLLLGVEGQDVLLENDGSGRFADVTLGRYPVFADVTVAVVLADVDRDGDPDAFTVNRRNQQDRLYANLTRHLDTPFALQPGKPFPVLVHASPRVGSASLMVLPWFSFRRLPAPLPVATFGTLWLDPAFIVALPVVTLTAPVDAGFVLLAPPSAPAITGTMYLQAAVVPVGNLAGIRLTNLDIDTAVR